VRGIQPAGAHSDEAKSYFTGEDELIIASSVQDQPRRIAGTHIKVWFDGPRGRWEER